MAWSWPGPATAFPWNRAATIGFAAKSGPQLCVAEAPGAVYGQSLADLQSERFDDARSLRDAKRVLRAAIDVCLDGRSLKSREVRAGAAPSR